MLKLVNVIKTFGDIKALEDVSFDVGDGEFVFITGPSGSGKSTIIKLILQQILPDSGEILLDDYKVGDLKPKELSKMRQKIGVVFQDFKMINERTLGENIEIVLAVAGVPQKEWKDRVTHVAELVGLGKKLNYFPLQLAGGELQRGALARALVINPSLILADEPTGNLDWGTAEGIMDLFEKINKEGKTVIMATHHLGIIEKHKKRTISLEDGKIVSDTGAKKDFKKHEKNDEKESDKD
jgi:cell division transport system ATP-binding protein